MARAGDPSGLSGDPKGAAGIPKARNPHVFLDISVDGEGAERMVFELFSDVVPKTAENFRSLCTGERGSGAIIKKPLHYKGTKIHRIVQGFMAQGGDFWDGDGCGGESVYGGKFPDENFRLKHDGPGVLSMANSGVHSNGSQFFVTFNAAHGLDGKHVVFGRVVSGWALLNKLEAVGSQNGRPSSEVKIVDCGEISDPNVLNKLDKLKEEAVDRTSAKRKDECHGSSSSQKRYRRYGENDGYDEHPMSRRHHHGDSQRSPSKRHHHHNSQKSPNPSRSSPSRRHHNHR